MLYVPRIQSQNFISKNLQHLRAIKLCRLHFLRLRAMLKHHTGFHCKLSVSKQPQFSTLSNYKIDLDSCLIILYSAMNVNTSWFTKIISTKMWRSSRRSRLALGFI